MATIKLTVTEWMQIYNRIKEEYKDTPATYMVRSRMRNVLGFTNRTHQYWKPDSGHESYDGKGSYVTEIHLDFYDSAAETMFRLKYL